MKEIKFRAWNKEEKIMSDLFTIWGITDGFIRFDEDKFIFDFEDDVEIMQYTGLKDKNGKEIYEGDIIEEKSIYRIFLIDWNDSEARFNLVFQHGENGYKGEFRHIVDVKNMEVIGNIYENPELLKGNTP